MGRYIFIVRMKKNCGIINNDVINLLFIIDLDQFFCVYEILLKIEFILLFSVMFILVYIIGLVVLYCFCICIMVFNIIKEGF